MVRNYSILDRSRIRHYYRVRNGEQTNVNCRYHIIRTHSFSKILEAVCSLSFCDQLFRVHMLVPLLMDGILFLVQATVRHFPLAKQVSS